MADEQEPNFDFATPEPPANWTFGAGLYKRLRGATVEAAQGREAVTALRAAQTDLAAAQAQVATLTPKATAAEQLAAERDQLHRQVVGLRAGIDDAEIIDVATSRYTRYAQAAGDKAKTFADWLPTDGKADKILAPHFARPGTPPAPGGPPATPPTPPAPAPNVITQTPDATPPAPVQISGAELEAKRRANGGRLDPETQDREAWALMHPGKPYPGFKK